MSEYDSLIEGYPGLDDPGNDPGPLTRGEEERLRVLVPDAEMIVSGETDEPPYEEGDWPEPEPEVLSGELRFLRPDQRPLIGAHYVVFGGVPRPVTRQLDLTEDEFVRTAVDPRDFDPGRRVRADRTLRLRFRSYLCGETNSL